MCHFLQFRVCEVKHATLDHTVFQVAVCQLFAGTCLTLLSLKPLNLRSNIETLPAAIAHGNALSCPSEAGVNDIPHRL